MEEEDQVVISSSDSEDSSDSYEEESQDSEGEYENSDCEDLAAVSPPSDADRKFKNVNDLLRGNLVVQRQPLLPRVLSVSEGAAVCRKPFKPPCSHGYNTTGQLSRRLSARKRFVPWGSSSPVVVVLPTKLNESTTIEKDEEEEVVSLPPEVEPLVLWQLDESDDAMRISVHPLLVRFLRPHQREGVQFMFDCVSGLHGSENINGCILADDMGLGKTLQSITLLYTLLCQGFDGTPMVKKAIIVTPTSLVSNWEAEIKKWVGDRIQLIALCESTRDDVLSGIDSFTRPRSALQVLIISYETFRMHSSKFGQTGSCDLLICDEAHRLKNDQTLTNKALASLTCKRRVLLSGTPMQNDLEEFFAMVNFTNPGSLGDAAHFRHYFEAPIICGREPTATEEEKNLAAARSTELSSKVNQFILRRTNALLSNHLPPKLIYDTIKSKSPGTIGFEDCLEFFPAEMFSGRSGAWTGGDGAWVELSGKMHVLSRLLANLRRNTDDRIVLVSNYTQTLDLFAQLCRERRYPYLRLDGSTSISKRQKLVNRLNDPTKDEFAFLLSSKAGGCGLNLIGANRLVLFDPDWNPANDKQAAARVWRDGQKKRVYVYRFLSTGTIEEKGNLLSTEDLRDLFSFHGDVRSEIHGKMSCSRCQNDASGTENTEEGNENNLDDSACQTDQEDIGGFANDAGCLHSLKISERQVGTPLEEDLASWGHHFTSKSVPDTILQASAGDEVTFVFTNQVDGKLIPIKSNPSPKPEVTELNRNQAVSNRGFNKPQQRPREPLQPLSPNETNKRVKLSTYKRLHCTSNTDGAQMQMPLQRPNQVSVNHDDDFV
ncbi:hypothetical protein DY000_02049928 [Brassica cretica]|uniref:Protein CHROMATIN REMODELING 25 n=1 Tax=Brassica cretica TaxID=69181 RepID=A0ABQ7EUB3_BRACR|nr:hypothetical protein DY000_02049928 [Brassica cretica]